MYDYIQYIYIINIISNENKLTIIINIMITMIIINNVFGYDLISNHIIYMIINR